jgi:hypothetical protein
LIDIYLVRYAPFRTDEELLEKIVPKQYGAGVQFSHARAIAKKYVGECNNFPDLISRLGDDADQFEQDKNKKSALLYIKAQVERIWRDYAPLLSS